MPGKALRKGTVHPEDLGFFVEVSAAASLSAAARELGITTSAVSKRLLSMESRLGVMLVDRNTRRTQLTHEGGLYLEYARRILGELEDMEQVLSGARLGPTGLLRVNAPLGFGQRRIAPLLGPFLRACPEVEVQLELSVDPPLSTDDGYDVCIRFGMPGDQRVIARRIAGNRRIICAAPAYIAAHGSPQAPHELAHHNCIGIRQGEDAYGLWRLTNGDEGSIRSESVKTHGSLSTNNGNVAVAWALEGQGIVMRGEWDLRPYVDSGRLVQLLPQWRMPDADLYAVYPPRGKSTSRVGTFIEFLSASFAQSGWSGAQRCGVHENAAD
jgi:DNA-binding transcriptional LysR family regulator